MTDRTDVDSPSQGEPSRPGAGDDVVWPVWGAGDRRPALHDETRQIPVVAERAPSGRPAAEPAERSEPAAEPAEPTASAAAPAEPSGPVEPAAAPTSAGPAPQDPAADEVAPVEATADEPGAALDVADEAAADEPGAALDVADEAAASEGAAADGAAAEGGAAEGAAPEGAADEAVVAADESLVDDAQADEIVGGAQADERVDDAGVVVEPVPDDPSADAGVDDARVPDEVAADPTVTAEPAPDHAADESSSVHESSAESSSVDEQQPVDEQPVDEQPVAEQPVAEQPVAEQPVAEQAASESPADAPQDDAAVPDETSRHVSATAAEAPDATAPGASDEIAESTGQGTAPSVRALDETAVVAPAADETVVLAPLPDVAATPAPVARVVPPVPADEHRHAGSAPTRESVLPGRAAHAAAAPPGQSGPAAPPVPPALSSAARVSAGTVPQQPREPSPFDEFEPEERTRRWPRRLLVGAGVLVALGGAYVGASYATADRVPRGTSVAGVDIGGLSSDDAVDRLTEELSGATGKTIVVQANDVQASIEPAAAGLSFDAQATVDGLTGVDLTDPLRLWHQVAGRAESEPVTRVDEAKLDSALEALGSSLSLAPVDGAVLFVDGDAVLTDATEGWALDDSGAADVIERDWLVAAQPLVLPTEVVEPAITQAAAQAALDDVAQPLVSAPISVTVSDKLAVLQPATLAAAASMQPKDGELVLQLDGKALAKEVVEQLPEGVLTSASDARFEFKDDKPVLIPGEPGTTVAPDDVAKAVAAVANAQNRTAVVELSQTDPSETTEAMEKLGIKEIVSEFSTPLTSEPRRTKNIAQGLANITGVLVRPGETFSLTESLGPIDAAHGFVQAGAIVNGEHSDAWGGGLSQVSTTTFNAAYLAGMEDVEHTPHSEWFSRYPEGREATIYTGSIDMKWKNTTPYGALVQGWVSGGRAYVRIWGTKYYTVESTTSGRSGVVQPSTVYSDSRTCTPQSAGNPGFSVTVTRKLFLDGDLTETTSKSWRYKPQNRVVCGEPPSKEDKGDD